MEEIKVGEYVRTDKGNIGKVIEKRFVAYEPTEEIFLKYYLDNSKWTTDLYIVNHSPNIIDLIEEGDYVNGYIVLDVMEDMKTGELHLEMPMDYTNPDLGDCTIYNKGIKSIVTKEQFQSLEYRLEE